MRYAAVSIVAGLLCGAVTLQAAAEVYKWKDKSGNIHYSQTPPASGDFETMAPPPPASDPSGSDARLQELQRSNEQAEQNRREQAERKQESEKEAAMRAENCNRARANKEVFTNRSPNTLVKNPDGTYARMTVDQRAERAAEAERMEAENCGP
jgi:hypothetical protein